MIFIIEGVDGTGKTTLAKTLCERHDMGYIHFGAPTTQKECDEMFDMYKGLLIERNNIVIDRCWYSDQVYGPILRGQATITPEQQKELEEILIAKGCQVYYCIGQLETLVKRCQERGEDLISMDQMPALIEGYERVIPTIDKSIPVIRYCVPEVSING